MPCRDDGRPIIPYEDHEKALATIALWQAVVCAVVRRDGLDAVVSAIDADSGLKPEDVRREIQLHQLEDARRKIIGGQTVRFT